VVGVRITYDRQVNAAYISLTGRVSTKPARMYACDPIDVDGMINLDFDDEDRLIGIEVLAASSKLPQQLLDAAEQIGADGA